MLHYEIKGNLFTDESLENLVQKKGQAETDFGLPGGTPLSEEIARTFRLACNQWDNFKHFREKLLLEDQEPTKNPSGLTETQTHWVRPLMSLLGYNLENLKSGITSDGKTFPINYQHKADLQFHVHIVGCLEPLDTKSDRGQARQQAPHVMVQGFLNHTEHLYAVVTNGLRLRLLRDHHRLTGIQYLEWDLEQLMEDRDLASFGLLYRLLHISRVKGNENSWLEGYHQDAIEEGYRVRENLQQAVKECLIQLGNGFLLHPQNHELRHALEEGRLSPVAFGEQLRLLVYRWLYLLVVEDRKVVFQPEVPVQVQRIYREHYSLTRLRHLAETHHRVSGRYSDLWEQLKNTFSFFEPGDTGEPLGIAPLGGQLFAPESLGLLRSARLANNLLLKALDQLCRFSPQGEARIRINYARINVEEFGAVYESLLHLNPKIDLHDAKTPFGYVKGDTRKSTGAYYTHDSLVQQLLKTTLEPVMRHRLTVAGEGIKDRTLRSQAQVAA
ncbi:MAG: restriction endonuclease, partial [Bacteroidota bacterium]